MRCHSQFCHIADNLYQCYLCPGNKRAQGDSNPQYESTFVFVNDYSAVKEDQAEYKETDTDGSTASLNTSLDAERIPLMSVQVCRVYFYEPKV